MTNEQKRLEYLRAEIEAERISTGEIAELQSLIPYIDPSDTVLLEWAGVPEFPHEHEYMPQLSSEDYENPVYMCDCGATKTK
ncbi:MAG: hypothetical protein KBD16_00675 [Candidatus Pacebacteria bacterium]|nr:hypothetical protein [Candidatus Paceibacterota bacterium]